MLQGGNFKIDAVFRNPTSRIANFDLSFYSSDNCTIENKKEVLSVHPKWTITKQVKAKITDEDKLAMYLVEGVFTVLSTSLLPSPPPIERFPSYEKWGEYEDRPIALTSFSEQTPPNTTFSPNHTFFAKIAVITEKIRKEWAQKSSEGHFCGTIGCESSSLEWKCPKCGFHFCSVHINHMDCEQLSKLHLS